MVGPGERPEVGRRLRPRPGSLSAREQAERRDEQHRDGHHRDHQHGARPALALALVRLAGHELAADHPAGRGLAVDHPAGRGLGPAGVGLTRHGSARAVAEPCTTSPPTVGSDGPTVPVTVTTTQSPSRPTATPTPAPPTRRATAATSASV